MTASHYRALVELFAGRHAGPLVEDLRHALDELEDLAARDIATASTAVRCSGTGA